MTRWRWAWIMLATAPHSRVAAAEPNDDGPSSAHAEDAYSAYATSETTLRWFRRALLPGPNGAVVETNAETPVHESWSLGVNGLDAFGQMDGLDLEVWGWLSADLVEREGVDRFTGDIGAAHATQHFGRTWVRVGRQLVAGGAARYSRFDGVASGVRLGDTPGSSGNVEAYAGYTVLPRWNEQPGYHHLGSLSDSLTRSPNALEEPERSGFHLVGVRGFYAQGSLFSAGLSFHEQQADAELQRRNAGFDLDVFVSDNASVSGDAVMDLDSRRFSDLRLWADLALERRVSVTAEYLHAEPSLYLSRQSVLSVFATDAYDEIGGELSYRPLGHLDFASFGYVEWYAERDLGGRFGARASFDVDRDRTTRLLVGYTRMIISDAGYHALRNSLVHRLTLPLTLTAEAYHYSYDEPIEGHVGSSVYAGNVNWFAGRGFSLLAGTSFASTPYAVADLQGLVRLTFEESFVRGSRERRTR